MLLTTSSQPLHNVADGCVIFWYEMVAQPIRLPILLLGMLRGTPCLPLARAHYMCSVPCHVSWRDTLDNHWIPNDNSLEFFQVPTQCRRHVAESHPRRRTMLLPSYDQALQTSREAHVVHGPLARYPLHAAA
jgi:hypothetical protein